MDLSVDSVRNAQEREGGAGAEAGEYLVEKILAKRFNPTRKHYEYLIKWEGYPHEQNTWEPVENMETCEPLLEAFEKQLARQKELKALRAQQQQQQHPEHVTQMSTPLPQVVKQLVRKTDSPVLTPTGRLQRTSKARALDQVKAWCEADEEPGAKRIKRELSSDHDFSDSDSNKEEKVMNWQSSPKSSIDPELVKYLGLGGKVMHNIKGVIKVDPKHMPNLTTGVYIMSKGSSLMKIDSPGKLGPGLNINQEVIRKQIMAAKQKKLEEAIKSPASTPASSQIRKTYGSGGQQVMEKTIITPSGQKIIQRTILRTYGASDGKSPVTILNRKLAQSDSLLRGVGSPGRGGARGRGRGYSVSTVAGNIVRMREKPVSIDFNKWEASSESSDGVEDPFPRELTLCPLTGRLLAPPATPPPPPPATHATMLMKDVPTIVPSQLAQLMPGGEAGALQPVAVQVEGEPGEDATQVIAQLVQADLPSPGGTRRVMLLLPDGSFTMTELDKEQYESITEAS